MANAPIAVIWPLVNSTVLLFMLLTTLPYHSIYRRHMIVLKMYSHTQLQKTFRHRILDLRDSHNKLYFAWRFHVSRYATNI